MPTGEPFNDNGDLFPFENVLAELATGELKKAGDRKHT